MNLAERIGGAATDAIAHACCLGRFRLYDLAGSELHLRTRKARAILALLALTRRPWPRDALAALLWSDRGEEQARASVRQAIFELRHVGDAGRPLLVVNRDEIAVDERWLTTDLRLIRSAAEEDDRRGLERALAASEPGLLTDLDGLDPEFDGWLRAQRAEEPARTLALALAAAERCFRRLGHAPARAIVAELLRLDPTSEEAVRLAMRIDHASGDRGALHRRFDRLRACLKDELDARPSPETELLFKTLTATSAAPPSPAEDAAGRGNPTSASPKPVVSWRRHGRWAGGLAAAALGAAVLAGSGAREPVSAASALPLVAVLPFDHQAAADSYLASGLWEDTRAAISHRSGLRVLGRSTTRSLVEEGAAPGDFERRFGVDYLLDGNLRRSGDRVRVVVSLSRAADGVAIWSGTFTGRLGDPLALQEAVAQGIEGRLRGRLARGGGRRPEQIATSPEVYALYLEARQLISTRDKANVRRADALLREAVAKDPNYAPAWAALAGAIHYRGRVAIADSKARSEAVAAVRRALTLAPNLAQAHATLAMLEGDNTPTAERALRRAVALDPANADAWNWLGNSLNSQYRPSEAMAAYQRAIAIDPLLQSAVRNLAQTASETGDRTMGARLLQQLRASGANPMLIGSLRADQLTDDGDYSGSLKLLQQLGRDPEGHAPPVLWSNWLDTLSGLGHFEHMHKVTNCPEWYGPLLEEKALPPRTFEGRAVLPEEFWTSMYFSSPASRAMVNRGQAAQLVRLYRAGFRDADAFISVTSQQALLPGLAPTLAVALAAGGARDEAKYLLATAARARLPALKSPGNRWARADLAAIRAAQGERAEALALLGAAVRQGWLPNGRDKPLDLAREPAFRPLRGDPAFEALRRRVLARIARERAELGPLTI